MPKNLSKFNEEKQNEFSAIVHQHGTSKMKRFSLVFFILEQKSSCADNAPQLNFSLLSSSHNSVWGLYQVSFKTYHHKERNLDCSLKVTLFENTNNNSARNRLFCFVLTGASNFVICLIALQLEKQTELSQMMKWFKETYNSRIYLDLLKVEEH